MRRLRAARARRWLSSALVGLRQPDQRSCGAAVPGRRRGSCRPGVRRPWRRARGGFRAEVLAMHRRVTRPDVPRAPAAAVAAGPRHAAVGGRAPARRARPASPHDVTASCAVGRTRPTASRAAGPTGAALRRQPLAAAPRRARAGPDRGTGCAVYDPAAGGSSRSPREAFVGPRSGWPAGTGRGSRSLPRAEPTSAA